MTGAGLVVRHDDSDGPAHANVETPRWGASPREAPCTPETRHRRVPTFIAINMMLY